MRANVLVNASARYPLLGSKGGEEINNVLRFLRSKSVIPMMVGGWVRDCVLGIDSKDVDIECFGDCTFSQVERWLRKLGRVEVVGKSFAVCKLYLPSGNVVDISFPRRERKIGEGHKGFEITADPRMSYPEAAQRRDFTFNALMYDPFGDVLYDFFDGISHLVERRILRHVHPVRFAEDPLRVLRGFRFCSRFGLVADRETVNLCRSLIREAYTLPAERVWEEWVQWAKGDFPSAGLRFLQETEWVQVYPELAGAIRCGQKDGHHPDKDVWHHILSATDRAAQICTTLKISGESRTAIMLAVLLHDVGGSEKCGGEEGAWGADTQVAERFLNRIGAFPRVIQRVLPLVRWHMRFPTSLSSVLRLSRDLYPATIWEWSAVVRAVCCGKEDDIDWVVKTATNYGVVSAPPSPILMGRHVLSRGIPPGKWVGEILRAAYEAQLSGEFHDLPSAMEWLDSYLAGKGGLS